MWSVRELRAADWDSINDLHISGRLNSWLEYQKDKWKRISLIAKSVASLKCINIVAAVKRSSIKVSGQISQTNGERKNNGG